MPYKNKKTGKGRLDKWYHMAKEQGYRARSAFKLVQLNKKYDFLTNAKCVLDLCAAPGGWLQVATKYMPANHTLVGVDLDPIKPIPNCETIVGDITTQQCRSDLRKAIGNQKTDVVLHDGAPNVGIAWAQDAYTQSELTLAALRLAVEFLRGGGIFVTKVFRSNDYNSLMWVFKQLFKKVEATKPPSSRNTSAEIFVVCEGFLNPKKIDPKMLDPKFVFQDVDETIAIPDVFSKKSDRIPRVGYEEGNVTQHKETTVGDFIDNPQPIPMLAQYNKFTFAIEDNMYKMHKNTVPEIHHLIADLRVLGKGDFKRLLKWRSQMVAFKESLDDKEESEEEEEEVVPRTAEEEEADENNQLDDQIRSQEKRIKKAKQKISEKKKKFQKRIDLKMVLPGDSLVTQEEDGLFQLRVVNDDLVMDSLIDADPEWTVEDEEAEVKQEEKQLKDALEQEELEASGDEENYDHLMEEYLDEMYEEYVSNKLNRTQRVKIGKKQKKEKEEEKLDDLEQLQNKRRKLDFEPKVSGDVFSSEEEDEMDFEEKTNSLIVNEKDAKANSKKAKLWFSQFNGLDEDDGESEAISRLKKKLGMDDGIVRLGPFFKDVKDEVEDDSQDESLKMESDEDEVPQKGKRVAQKGKRFADSDSDSESAVSEEEDFETVPVERMSDDEGSTSESELEEEEKFYGLALGTMMVRDRRARRDMIDDTYNRYAFNDKDLPKWFTEDENKHNIPQIPITKEIVQEMKMKARELNARPIKKVAEAKARKKMKAMKKLEKVKTTAQHIADSSEMTPAEKTRQIEKLYKKQAKLAKFNSNAKTYVVTSGAGKSKKIDGKKGTQPGRTKHVDARMKKETRAKKFRDGKSKGTKRKRR